jgi:hypothetical protein
LSIPRTKKEVLTKLSVLNHNAYDSEASVGWTVSKSKAGDQACFPSKRTKLNELKTASAAALTVISKEDRFEWHESGEEFSTQKCPAKRKRVEIDLTERDVQTMCDSLVLDISLADVKKKTSQVQHV